LRIPRTLPGSPRGGKRLFLPGVPVLFPGDLPFRVGIQDRAPAPPGPAAVKPDECCQAEDRASQHDLKSVVSQPERNAGGRPRDEERGESNQKPGLSAVNPVA